MYNEDYINTDGNLIHRTAIVGSNVRLGTGNVIMPYAVIGERGFIRRAEKKVGKVIIGDNNQIGCHATIMAGENGKTVIGDDNLIMNYVNIGHNVKVGHRNEIGAKTIICGHTIIGNGNHIKTAVAIRNRLKIGHDNVIGMRSNVIRNYDNGLLIYGNPAKFQRNYDMDENDHDDSE